MYAPPVTGSDELERLGELFAREAARRAERGLGGLLARDAPPPDRELVELWAAHAEAARGWAEAQAEGWARRVVAWLHTRNQFLQVAIAEVAAAIRRAIDRAAREGDLMIGLRGLEEELGAQLGEAPVEVVCSEYSPELQLRLLGLAEVRGPALDVGCGAEARLVALLRSRGVAAEGIDRVRGDDWLDPRHYAAGRWATVLSHQAFSLHFLHHHFRSGPTALTYAETYMAALRGLQAGGVFAYAPGLPFIEAMLPRGSYRVVRVPLADGLRVAVGGLSVAHATQVWPV